MENRNGLIYKAAYLEQQDVTDEELQSINKLALAPLSADEVFTFKAILCDTELDRQYEYFTAKALRELQKLYLGRTVIKDHNTKTDNQVARIYATEVVDSGKLMDSGEPYLQLVARCYMVRTASNTDLIIEIRAGIKKEGSVGLCASERICSICGTNNVKMSYCRHFGGRSYEKDGRKTVCTFKLDGVSEAYEFSLVAVPAQRAAGVSKTYIDGAPMIETSDDETDTSFRALSLRRRLTVARQINNNIKTEELKCTKE